MVVIFAAAGCGGSKPPAPGTPSAAEYLITAADLHRQPAGSPQEALLSWWRSIQYDDFQGYLSGLAAPLRAQQQTSKAARDDVALVSGELIRSQPQMTEAQQESDSATLYTRIETRQPVGATRFTTSSYPQAFTLVREAGKWKISDDFFVESRAANIRRAVNEAKASAGPTG